MTGKMLGTRLKRIGAAVLLTMVALAGNAQAACVSKTVSGSEKAIPLKGLNQSLLNQSVVSRINLERCKRGLPALATASGLKKQAARHSTWMARNQRLSHKASGSFNRTLKDRLRASGVKFRTGAENIGQVHLYGIDGKRFMIRSSSDCHFTSGGRRIGRHSYRSLAGFIVQKWMDSPSHRKNILSRNLRFSGVGAGVQPSSKHCGAVFVTHIFAG